MEPTIYKQGLSLKDVSDAITDWIDVTSEFTPKLTNMFFNGGSITKNEILKELKFSIRVDFHIPDGISANGKKTYNDIFSHNYSLISGSTSLNGAYVDEFFPKAFCMMWNDNSTFNIQIYNPTSGTSLKGFVISGIVLYE